MKPQSLLLILGVLNLVFFFVGCAKTEDENTMPWAQPAGWEGNKMPGMMPNYGDRNY